ncbi:MAG: hypothetical protein A2W75_03810 [Nitrospinae bacterium RIFCSPLOWO2_12_39_15]|nr:MAG: hypothetical protein A2W75_03810 [Nitrospinae bacterium RIFCSPLOWO2_12_39_15]
MINLKISPYNDFWMDNAAENFYRIVKEIEDVESGVVEADLSENNIEIKINDKNKFVSFLKDKIINRRDRYIFFVKEDPKTKLKNNVKKNFVIMQYGAKTKGKNVLKEQIYSDGDISPLLEELIKDLESEKKKKSCVLCNRKFAKSIGNLKQSIYPFSTKIKSLSGVRTELDSEHNIQQMKDYFDNVCPVCYLIGALEWSDGGIVYRCYLNGKSIFLLPSYGDLKKLHQIKSKYINGLPTGESKSNVIFKFKKATGEEGSSVPVGNNTLMLGFLEKVIDECLVENVNRISFWEVRKKYGLDSWILVEVPSGTVKNIRQHHLKIKDNVLNLIGLNLENKFKIYEQIIYRCNMKYMEDNSIFWDETEVLKENMARCIIDDDYEGFASAMLPRKKAYFDIFLDKEEREKFSNKFIYEWRWKKMGLTVEELETLSKAAKVVAKVADGHIGDLYKLDKARDLTDLLEGLQQIAKRVIGLDEKDMQYLSFKEMEEFTNLLHIRSEDFKDLKSTLIIYSCMELAGAIRNRTKSN